MLADVLRERNKRKQEELQQENASYNHPYKRDTIIYFSEIHIIGGIEKWIENLSRRYEFSVVYDKGDKERLEEYKRLGIEAIKYVGQDIECDTLIRMSWGNAKIKAKRTLLFIHAIHKEPVDIPKCDEIYAVSKEAAKEFEKTSGREVNVLYNPVDIEKTTKPLFLGVFSRLSKEKGRWRIEYLIDKLNSSKRPYLMLIFTDLPFDIKGNVIFIKPTMNATEWMRKCDYIVQLSDTEAGSLTIQESLKLGVPVIVTKLPILEEFNVNKSNAKILDFDMSNLDIDDLWNIPKFKWSEPISKEWDFMKKRVLREKLNEKATEVYTKQLLEVAETKVKDIKKKTTKKKVA